MINKIKKNVWQVIFKRFGSCVYLIKHKGKNILIDTSSKENREELIHCLRETGVSPEQVNALILTHNHWDHTGNVDVFKNAKIYRGKEAENESIEGFRIIHSPGHTQTDICIIYKDVLFSGDVLFHNGFTGRTDFPESSPVKMKKSIEKLRKIKYQILCPGHII